MQDLNSPSAAPQLLVSKNEIKLGAPAYGSGLCAFHFAGDLDGDNKLDVLLDESGDRYTSVMLFLSSKAEPGFLLKLIRKVVQACC